METALIEAAKQVPALLVMAWLVQLFLRKMGDRDREFVAEMQRRDQLLVEQANACHVEQRESRAALAANTRALAGFEAETREGAAIERIVRRVVRDERAA